MNYKSVIDKIEQGKKYISFVAALLLIVSIPVQALQAKLDNPIYVKGYKCNDGRCEPVIIGVQGASYVVSPAQDSQTFLSFHTGMLKLTQDSINRESLFSFSLATEKYTDHYILSNVDSGIIKDNHKDICFIEVISDHKFHLLLREHEDDSRAAFLQYNIEKKAAALKRLEPLKDDDNLLVIKPIYEFLSLEQKGLDRETWLFKIPKKEKISGKTLSVAQIQALYTLKYGDDSSKQFTVVHEDKDFIYAYTNSLSYCTKGLSIQSADLPLRISHIKQFSKLIKDSEDKIEEINKSQDVVEVAPGKTLILIPDYSNQSVIPLFGDITITPGESGILHCNYDKKVACKMKGLLALRNTGSLLTYPDYVVEFTDDSIQFTDTSNGLITVGHGRIAYVFHKISKEVVSDLGEQAFKSADRLSKGIESFGGSIEEASKTASEALLKSSENVSAGMKYSITSLNNAIIFASQTFENAVQFMSSKASNDMKLHVPHVLNSLKDANRLLGNNLKEVSKTLSKGANDAMEVAGKSLEKAFEELSKALENSSGNMSEAINIASKNFIEGMNKIKEGLSNMSVDIDWF